jgi:hypothetical protein
MTAYRERRITDIAAGNTTECEGGEGTQAEAVLYPDAEVVTRMVHKAGRQPVADKCACLTCTSGYPNPGGYRPHTLNEDCWCIGAHYFGECEITKDFPEVPRPARKPGGSLAASVR